MVGIYLCGIGLIKFSVTRVANLYLRQKRTFKRMVAYQKRHIMNIILLQSPVNPRSRGGTFIQKS